MLPPEALGKDLFQVFLLASGSSLAYGSNVHMTFFLCVCVCVCVFSKKAFFSWH